jgi:p-hydroxybenzoate 3-monooxygenase
MLGQLLSLMSIDNVIVESRPKEYVEGRSRAGQITPATVKILTESGVGSRIASEGMVHSTLQFHYEGATRELNLKHSPVVPSPSTANRKSSRI